MKYLWGALGILSAKNVRKAPAEKFHLFDVCWHQTKRSSQVFLENEAKLSESLHFYSPSENIRKGKVFRENRIALIFTQIVGSLSKH